MDYKWEINRKFEENPVLVRAEFKHNGKEWLIELNNWKNKLFAFICIDGKLQGQVPMDETQDDFLQYLKTKEDMEDLKIDVLRLF